MGTVHGENKVSECQGAAGGGSTEKKGQPHQQGSWHGAVRIGFLTNLEDVMIPDENLHWHKIRVEKTHQRMVSFKESET